MDPLVGAGLMSVANSAINGMFSTRANSQSWAQARQVMDREDWRIDNAHQREVADLKAAGLNPTLSAGGNGAPTGSGQMGQVNVPQVELPQIYPQLAQMEMQKKQLAMEQQKIVIEKAKTASSIAKNLTSQELDKAKTINEKRGLLNKVVGSEDLNRVDKIIKKAKDYWMKPKVPTNSPSSGGEIQQQQP